MAASPHLLTTPTTARVCFKVEAALSVCVQAFFTDMLPYSRKSTGVIININE